MPLRSGSVLWSTNISTENCDITHWSKNFLDTLNYWMTIGFPYGIFRHFETKNFQKTSWYFPLLLIHKHFGYHNFTETQHRRVLLRNVSVLKDKKFSTENLDKTLLSINFFNTRNRSKTKGLPYELFRHFDTKIFRRKNSIIPPHPYLFINYFATRNFLKQSQNGSSTKSFGNVRQRIFDENFWYSPLSYP